MSRSMPIVSVRIIGKEQDGDNIYSDKEIEQHWNDSLKKGKYQLRSFHVMYLLSELLGFFV